MDTSGLIIPIGDIHRDLPERLAKVLSEKFFISFNIGESLEIPKQSYNPNRNQYHSSVILKALGQRYGAEKVLGVIDKDLYVPRLNFVFGEAELNGRCALISIARLRQEFYNLPKDDGIFFDRVIKESTHELGHTHGLVHCLDSSCVMFFSNSLIDTDKKSPSFCKNCERHLKL